MRPYCILLIVIALLLNKPAQAQYVIIPDSNFAAFLNTNYSACMNGNLMDTTCAAIVMEDSINCSNRAIVDLTGVQYFDNLLHLVCLNNQISSISDLPESLTYIDCGNNQLTSLPDLPNGLTYLKCSYNQLVNLPPLPHSLIELFCPYNQLTFLPYLPGSLIKLLCYNNQLTTLPMIPSTVRYLSCFNNQLMYLPPLPDTLFICKINNNISLGCLTGLENFFGSYWEIDFSGTDIQCLPNFVYHPVPIPLLDTLPICGIFNQNNCPVGWSIGDYVSTDTDANCLTNDGVGIENIKINLYDAGMNLLEQFVANWNGNYFFDPDTGSYFVCIDTAEISYSLLCPMGNIYPVSVTSSETTNSDLDFKLICNTGFDVGVQSAVVDSGILRPGNFAIVKIVAGDLSSLHNLNCARGVAGVVKVTLHGPATYVSPAIGALTPLVSNDSLIYSIPDFGSVNSKTGFNIKVLTDTTAQLGDEICLNIDVYPTLGDVIPINNTFNCCFAIINSYDPNDKQVSPAGIIDTSQEWLTYTIRFQNTGNAPAQHIYIMDTLDANFDEGSFQLLSSSHEPVIQIIGNIMKFNFPGINLPDSLSNEPGSHGYIQYKIKLKENLPIGTEIQNTAYIYFDFNSPVQTNTVSNTIDVTTAFSDITSHATLHIYPNPVKSGGTLHLISKGKLNGRLSITDMTGRVVHSLQAFQSTNSVSLPEFAPGIYQVMVEGVHGNVNARIVVY